MANLDKYHGDKAEATIKHIVRTYRRHSNSNIQPDMKGENYDLVDHGITPLRYYNRCLKRDVCVYRANSVTLCSWVISAPEEIRGDDIREREFFETCYVFVKDRYFEGDDRFIITAKVHRDEINKKAAVDRWGNPVLDNDGKQIVLDEAKTDHIHIAYIPALPETKASSHYAYKCGAKYMHDRKDLIGFHDDLQKWCNDHLAYHVTVVGEKGNRTVDNGGNRTIEEVKQDHIENNLTVHHEEKQERSRWLK